MVGTIARAKLIAFPQPQRDTPHVVALLYEKARGNGTIYATAHGDHDLNLLITLKHGFFCSGKLIKKNPCWQAAQKDLRGEPIERNEAYESFSAAC
jgi:hypothetical protein